MQMLEHILDVGVTCISALVILLFRQLLQILISTGLCIQLCKKKNRIPSKYLHFNSLKALANTEEE